MYNITEGGARISDVNINGKTALSLAIAFGRYSLVQWLLDEGGANIKDTTVLQFEHGNV
jgi:ankyrin repeat protein